PDEGGGREPPADAGAGGVRLLDRELWGRRALHVRSSPSFTPERALYSGLPYQPPEPDALTVREGETVQRFIGAAKARGMAVWLQVQSAIPPGYRVQFGGPHPEDAPLGPNGAPVPDRVDANASLAAPAVLAYGEAMLRDLVRAYPQIDGFRIDWPEYPPYSFGSLFFDFSPHALALAEGMGIDVERMRRDALTVLGVLTSGLGAPALARAEPMDVHTLERALARHPGMLDLLALKRRLSLDMLARYRAAIPDTYALVPQAFPPPWHLVTGFDLAAATQLVEGIGVKFYTMHWPMILGNWARAMSTGKDDKALAAALVRATGLGEDAPSTTAGFVYPEPHEPHPASSQAIAAKMATARREAGDHVPLYAFTHAYGPLADVMRRAEACWHASGGRMWVNRYGYMSDEKIAAFGTVVRGAS
ncbi:MAG: hypothetical protein AAF321_10575, partial [Pseudomonadota bacterium]